MSERVAQSLTKSSAAVTLEDVEDWFSKIKKNLEEKNLLNISPHRMLNLDESAFQIVPSDNIVLTKKSVHSVHKVISNEKACLTVLCTISAAGQLLPPTIMFKLKNPPKKKF